MTSSRSRALLVGALFAASVVAQTPVAESQPTSKPVFAPPSDKRADKDVDIKKECAVLEDVARRRSALRFLKLEKEAREAALKTIDPDSANAVRRLVENDQSYRELDYHFVEKIKNCELRILNRLRADKFQGLADLLEALKGREHPKSAAFANLAGVVDLNYRFAVRKGLVEVDDAMKDVAKKFAAEVTRLRGTSGLPFDDLAKNQWKETKPDDFPCQWFDRSSEIISFEFGAIPDAKAFPRVDLATATREELLGVPEVEAEIADSILKYRKRRGFRGAEELRLIENIPPETLEPLQSVCTVGRGGAPAPKKKWTVMVYLNAATYLEPFGIKDLNEMEFAGSTADVNVVVELARYQGKQAVKPNGGYLSNPYSDFSGAFYYGLDNQPGTCRYYVLKDDDALRVRSVMIENIGETDAGRPEPLTEFGKWAVESFPAENYALVIWNHGAGWSGVSYDDNSHHGMDLPDVRQALERVQPALAKQGKSKIDVLDFDACLMATVEVAYELKDVVDYLASSQETEPGDGMAYGEYLKWLTTYPEAPPASLAKAMVETYVKAYAPGGVQTEGEHWFGSETKSAMRLSRIAATKDAIEVVAKLLAAKPGLLGDVAEEIVRESRRFGRLVDLRDFLVKVAAKEKDDAALKAAIDRVHELIGYPDDVGDKLINEVVVSRRSPGAIIWGFNGWASPPRNLAPFVANARFAKTPLVGPDAKGNYTAKITFPPMLKNAKSGKLEFVKEINYRYEDEQEKRTFKDFANTFFTADFSSEALVIAEGHNIGNNRSHGVSLYFPAYLGFDKDYRRLKFAENSAWADLCAKFPIKTIDKRAPVATLGVNHVVRGERERLGKIAVREEFEKVLRDKDWEKDWREDLKALGKSFDGIRDPKPYGEDWEQTLAHYRDGVVILDNHRGGELGGGPDLSDMQAMMGGGGWRPRIPRIVGPQGRAVLRHLQAGGSLLLGSSEAARDVWDTPLYRDALGLEYDREWNRGFKFNVRGVAGLAADKILEVEPAKKGESITVFRAREGDAGRGVEPFCILPDGKLIGVKIARRDETTGKDYRAVVLGFFLADVKNADDRRALLKDALAFLDAKRAPTPDIQAARPAADSRPIDPVGTAAAGAGGPAEK
jgi:hypothetical protein